MLCTNSCDGDHFCPTSTSASAFCLPLSFPSPNSHPPPNPRSPHAASYISELSGTYLLGVATSLAAQWQSSDVILGHATHHVYGTSMLSLVSDLIQIWGDGKGRPDGCTQGWKLGCTLSCRKSPRQALAVGLSPEMN